ncbi:MAG TPA: bifunctional phosphopantothenoylcysteine decarboxylase/phosphopantothenate--cysteine ligase CoaBC [Chitinophagaceae bacterium]|nr:bifunctional phosphopantothenoylcysteine decarboxylase/phosphopantothenate--cysteine ligase CoaBC [Chitinophagaceae bacterium]
MLTGKKILLGVTGSIAAYKAIMLVRLLIKAGAEVKVIMTPSAKDFVSPLTFSTLSKNEVLTDLFNETSWADHVRLGRWADVIVIAPLSCNTLAKMANGLCDNLLLAVYLSATCPVIVAPAMDEDMWHHPSTKLNIEKITSFENRVIPVANGELASGLYGDGRMAEPEDILQYLQDFFFSTKELTGKKILVSAGPTQEAIDPVRYISNHSSGKMGIAIAEEFADRGADVTLILGPSNLTVSKNIHTIKVISAQEMYDACMTNFFKTDIAVMAAAVADYTPQDFSPKKIKKTEDVFTIDLTKTNDILKKLGEQKSQDQIIVGFALETNNEKENALSKLEKKKIDLIVLNSLNDNGAGFGTDTNKISIFDNRGNEVNFETKSKLLVAKDIVNTIIQYKNA